MAKSVRVCSEQTLGDACGYIHQAVVTIEIKTWAVSRPHSTRVISISQLRITYYSFNT